MNQKNYLKNLCLLVALSAGAGQIFAQGVALDWVRNMGGKSDDNARKVTVDGDRNVYTAGYFSDTARFINPGTDTVRLVAIKNTDAFVAKQDAAGNFIWARQLGGKGSENVQAVTTDHDGNVYIIGDFSDTLQVNPGPDLFATLNHMKINSDIFIAKLNSAGDFLWVRHLGGPSYNNGLSVVVDGDNNVYVGGAFTQTLYLDAPSTTGASLQSAGLEDGFIIKLDSSGNRIWTKKLGAAGYDNIVALTLDQKGGLYATGMFDGTVQFGNTTMNSGNRFISKLDTAGNFTWTKALSVAINDIAVDTSGNVLTVGIWYNSSEDFNPDPNASFMMFGSGGQEVFVLKLDATGTFVWARQLAADMDEEHLGVAITTDLAGNVYTTGFFMNETDFNPDPGVTNALTASAGLGSGGWNVFVWKLNPDGNYKWAKRLGGTDGSDGNYLTVDKSGNVYTTGVYRGTAEFDPGPGSHTLPSTGGSDMFIHKMICTDTTSSLIRTVLCNDVYRLNGLVFDSTGIYKVVVPNGAGCDSTITLDLTVYKVEKPVILTNGYTLSVSGSYNYQWLRNGIAEPGETGNTYQVSSNGNYQVVASVNAGCSDTSDVYSVSNVGIDGKGTGQNFSFYPNPSSRTIYLNTTVPLDIRIISPEGQLIREADQVTEISVEDLAQGVYFLQITGRDSEIIATGKFMKVN